MAARPASLRFLDPSTLFPAGTALFLDFDGTLADIAERPDAVFLAPATHSLLARLHRKTGGATAIVTGRPISEIDGFLEPLRLPVAGVHGLERRGTAGDTVTASIDAPLLERLRRRLTGLADALPGIILEVKPGSVALHYRHRPELERQCLDAVHKAVADLGGLEILHGKMVVEVKAGKGTKGGAIAAFMEESPFRGRRPVFAGDDVTDEDAFGKVAQYGGISIKIGPGATGAGFRARGTAEFHRWLSDLASAFEAERRTG